MKKLAMIPLLYQLMQNPVYATEEKKEAPIEPQKLERTIDKEFLIHAGVLFGMTVYDIESSYYKLGKYDYDGAREGNPIARPFVDKGRPVLYAYSTGINLGMLGLNYILKRKGYNKWWIPSVSQSSVHGICGTINITF